MDERLEHNLRAAATSLARHTRPAADAQDLMQEARAAIWRHGDADNGVLYVVGKRAMVDAVRTMLGRIRGEQQSHKARGHARTESYDAWGYPMDSFARTSPSAETVALAKIELERAAASLGRLDDRAREVVLANAAGASLGQLARRHGVTEARMSQVRTAALARVERDVDGLTVDEQRARLGALVEGKPLEPVG